MIAQIVVFSRKERKILRFAPQKLRKSFANGNLITYPVFIFKKSELSRFLLRRFLVFFKLPFFIRNIKIQKSDLINFQKIDFLRHNFSIPT